MGQDSKIEWTTHTANLWWGCSEVHAGCDHCYARTFARAKGKASAWDGARFAVGSIWGNLAKWNAAAAKAGEIRRVFTGSMMDIFEKPMPALTWAGEPMGVTTGDLRDRYFREVIPATPNLLHLMLTKRPGNIPKMVPPEWLVDWPANVMTGTSVVNQATADTLIPQLIDVPGWHFLSMEPLLGPVDFRKVPKFNRIGYDLSRWWIIVGGESGHGARPMHPMWVRQIRDQCMNARVPFLFKQWGEFAPLDSIMDHDAIPHDRIPRYTPVRSGIPMDEPASMFRVGKKAAGRMLDGREWDEFPTPHPVTARLTPHPGGTRR